MKKEYVKICPKCGSTNLKQANFLKPSDSFAIHTVGTAVFNEAYCVDCGYNGIYLEAEKSKLKNFKRRKS